MVGDKRVIDGIEYEVVWDGGEGLVGDRQTLNNGIWDTSKRLYTKKSEFWVNGPKSVKEPQNEDVLCDSGTD